MTAVVESYTFDADTTVVLFNTEDEANGYINRRWNQCMDSEREIQSEEFAEDERTLVEAECSCQPGMGVMAWLHDPYNSSETLDDYNPENLDRWYIQAVEVTDPKV